MARRYAALIAAALWIALAAPLLAHASSSVTTTAIDPSAAVTAVVSRIRTVHLGGKSATVSFRDGQDPVTVEYGEAMDAAAARLGTDDAGLWRLAMVPVLGAMFLRLLNALSRLGRV